MSEFTRKGLHRLECECGHYLYATVAAVENHGLPSCACGERFTPARRELAMLLNVSCAAITEFETAKALGMNDREAARWVEQQRRTRARARRMAAIGQ
jgi:hypothetical protein